MLPSRFAALQKPAKTSGGGGGGNNGTIPVFIPSIVPVFTTIGNIPILVGNNIGQFSKLGSVPTVEDNVFVTYDTIP